MLRTISRLENGNQNLNEVPLDTHQGPREDAETRNGAGAVGAHGCVWPPGPPASPTQLPGDCGGSGEGGMSPG